MKYGTKHLRLRSYLNPKFSCSPEPFGIDHLWLNKAVCWTPGSTDQPIREKMRPALMDSLWSQHFHRQANALLHPGKSLGLLPQPRGLLLSAKLPSGDGIRGLIEKQVAVLVDDWMLPNIWRTL